MVRSLKYNIKYKIISSGGSIKYHINPSEISEEIINRNRESNLEMIEKINKIMELESVQIQKLNRQLSSFVIESTTRMDQSHDYFHMLKVLLNSLDILDHDYYGHPHYVELKKMVITVAWLHDVRDYKYEAESITEEQMLREINYISLNFFKSETDEAIFGELDYIIPANQIIKIVDYISFSKEDKSRKETPLRVEPIDKLNGISLIALHIVADADRLEALGKVGIERCFEYGRIKLGNPNPNRVILQLYRKELRLLEEGFLKTKRGYELAKPLHKEMLEWVKNTVKHDPTIEIWVQEELRKSGLIHLYREY